MYPIIVPCFGFDDHLAANLAIALTGMGVDMGNHVSDDARSTSYFDDIYFSELNRAYLEHRVSLGRFVEQAVEYFTARSEPWGFKMSVGLELLPMYKHFLPEMSLLIGVPDKVAFYRDMFYGAMDHDRVDALTLKEYWDKRAMEDRAIEEATQLVPSMMIPASFFDEQREKALIKIVEFIGIAINRDQRGRLVKSALRKLSMVYSMAESKQRMEVVASG